MCLCVSKKVHVTRYTTLFILLLSIVGTSTLHAQLWEAGAEYTFGRTYTTFQGELSELVGFEELELTDEDIDAAFAELDLNAPRWVKDLFPGLRIDIEQEISKRLSRNNRATRFYGRFSVVGASFMISQPRLSEPLASKQLGNQVRSVRLALNGDAEALSQHLADIALEESQQVKPFFSNRYDVEVYVHAKKLIFGDAPLFEFGENSYIDAEVTTGLRLTADPSPVVELGSLLFISEQIDSLLEGGLLRSVEETTDEIALSIQNSVFGKFKDPRVISSMGWFTRASVPIHFGQSFSFLVGTEISVQKHLAVAGTKPMFSAYGFGGVRWRWKGADRKRGRR
jgi:hypothetical protein